MSEEKEIKEQFGLLGLYLIDKAEKKIKELNQNTLFQKAEIKKNHLKRMEENSQKIKNHFIEVYDQFLNNSLSNTLIKEKADVLNLKNKLLGQFELDLKKKVEQNITEYYSNYISYFLSLLRKNKAVIDKPPKVSIILNSRDYEYFNHKPNKIKEIIKNDLNLLKSEEDFIGGFKVILDDYNISYDYTINSFILKNSTIIEKQFSTILSESEINQLQRKFEDFINNKRLSIKEYLKGYD